MIFIACSNTYIEKELVSQYIILTDYNKMKKKVNHRRCF